MIFSCPNCGAPLHRAKCEYCGTEFIRIPDENLVQIKLHLFEEQMKVEELYKSVIKAFHNYHF